MTLANAILSAELLPYDIQGTLLHAGRLHAAGLLDDAELAFRICGYVKSNSRAWPAVKSALAVVQAARLRTA